MLDSARDWISDKITEENADEYVKWTELIELVDYLKDEGH